GINAPVLLDGGYGDDTLSAGSKPAILVGSAGNDVLIGGVQRDILIGGNGSDLLRGNGGDDILIGGRPTHTEKTGLLFNLQSMWTSGDPYKSRVQTISTTVGDYRHPMNFVIYDDGIDQLEGGKGTDWFFAGHNTKIYDWDSGEFVS